ncbi:hypothetical protein HSX11_17855 [Oxalobacteraceae bacterium]|nr:hypothetical protein [Oxalobacteraceae bacterium]
MQNGFGGTMLIKVFAVAVLCSVALAQGGPRHVLQLAAPAVAGAARDGALPGSVTLRADGGASIVCAGMLIRLGAPGAPEANGMRSERVLLPLAAVGPAAASAYAPDRLAREAEVRAQADARPDLLVLPEQDGAAAAQLAARLPERGQAIAATEALAQALRARGYTRVFAFHSWDALHLNKGKTQLRLTALAGRDGGTLPAGFMLDFGQGRGSYRIYLSGGAAPTEQERAEIPRRYPGADMAVLDAGGQARLALVRRGGHQGAATLQEVSGASIGFALLRR